MAGRAMCWTSGVVQQVEQSGRETLLRNERVVVGKFDISSAQPYRGKVGVRGWYGEYIRRQLSASRYITLKSPTGFSAYVWSFALPSCSVGKQAAQPSRRGKQRPVFAAAAHAARGLAVVRVSAPKNNIGSETDNSNMRLVGPLSVTAVSESPSLVESYH